MDLATLCSGRSAYLPCLLSIQNHADPWFLHHQYFLRGPPQGTPLTSQFLLLSSCGVAAVAKDSFSFGAGVAAVAKDSFGAAVAAVAKASFSFGAAVATIHLPFQTCSRRILLEASSAEFCAMGSGIVPATRHATFLNSLGLCFGIFRHVASPENAEGSDGQPQKAATETEPKWLRSGCRQEIKQIYILRLWVHLSHAKKHVWVKLENMVNVCSALGENMTE